MKQLFAVIESLITVVLVLAGVAGLSYRTFREGGWLSRGVGKVVDAYLSYPIVAIVATVAVYFVYRSFRDRANQGRGGKMFDYVVYVLMAVGIYFIGHYILTGNL